MKMIAATNNDHKLIEIRDILKDTGVRILSLKDIGLDIEVEENGSSFEENALIKAREICKATGQATMADDSGLEVAALDGAPGIRSARYSGETGALKDKKNNEKLLANLEGVPAENRDARFCSAVAAVFPDGREFVVKGFVYGKIGFAEAGHNGFGYDPLFIVDGYGKTMAELGAEVKNKISHRSNALKEFVQKIKEYI